MDAAGRPADGELYRSFLDGETTAYDQLVTRYGDSLTMYLFGYLHDWQNAEDMVIEAFARIMVKRPSIRDGAFKAYLFRTGRNLAINLNRKKRRQQEFSVDGMDGDAAESVLTAGAAGGPDLAAGRRPVEEDVQTEERNRALHLCLDRIEPELREALWLIYFEEMSYAQAAQVLGVKEKRVSRLLVRGKQQMRKELEKEGVSNAYE